MPARYLVTGAGGTIGGVSNAVVELLIRDGAEVRALVHHDDHRVATLRILGADVTAGDLTEPSDVVAAMDGVNRMFFNMGVSSSYLEAAAVVSAVGREHRGLETVVNMSQMTVSQMSLTSGGESNQQRLHWLSEHVMDWSGLPVTHVRPTVFMDNPLFTFLAAPSVRERHTLALPFGDGRTSPIAALDVARVVATLLREPEAHRRHVYELTGPDLLDIDGLARNLAGALDHPVTGVDVPHAQWVEQVLTRAGLPTHIEHHIEAMARLHRAHRYERLTDDVERVTGRPAITLQQYAAENPGKFGG